MSADAIYAGVSPNSTSSRCRLVPTCFGPFVDNPWTLAEGGGSAFAATYRTLGCGSSAAISIKDTNDRNRRRPLRPTAEPSFGRDAPRSGRKLCQSHFGRGHSRIPGNVDTQISSGPHAPTRRSALVRHGITAASWVVNSSGEACRAGAACEPNVRAVTFGRRAGARRRCQADDDDAGSRSHRRCLPVVARYRQDAGTNADAHDRGAAYRPLSHGVSVESCVRLGSPDHALRLGNWCRTHQF